MGDGEDIEFPDLGKGSKFSRIGALSCSFNK